MLIRIPAASLMLFLGLLGFLHAQSADLILTGGKVRTATGWADAMAVRRGVIVAVGDAAQVARRRGPRTRVIDLHGGAVLPGLHDTHVHPLHGGISARRCKVPQGSNLAATQAIVKACAARARPGEWVLGGQWDAPPLGAVPNRKALDQVAPNEPVLRLVGGAVGEPVDRDRDAGHPAGSGRQYHHVRRGRSDHAGPRQSISLP